jgi:hypothetical protein
MRLDRLEEAESSILQAVDLHKPAHSTLGEGTDRMRLGELYTWLDRLQGAIYIKSLETLSAKGTTN